MRVLVTHKSPDIDAITSVWLFKRFWSEKFADAKVLFVDAGSSLDMKAAEAEVGQSVSELIHTDTGWGEFDHHQPERGGLRVCATSLVYQELGKHHPDLKNNWALQQIVEYALADDHFENYFWAQADDEKHLFNFGSILQGLEYAGLHTDETQLHFGFRCLDGIYASLRHRQQAMEEIAEKGIPFSTRWGKSLAVATSNDGVLKYAQLQGNVIVIQKDPKTGHVRIKAAPLPEVDLTSLYTAIMEAEKKHAQPGTWFFHNGKHMVLNGSRKAVGKHTPSPLSLEELIALAKNA